MPGFCWAGSTNIVNVVGFLGDNPIIIDITLPLVNVHYLTMAIPISMHKSHSHPARRKLEGTPTGLA
jgi:hypothetical protein